MEATEDAAVLTAAHVTWDAGVANARAGRFLITLGGRTVRRTLRLRVSLPGKLRGGSISDWTDVELVDLTTAGARIRGVELPVGTSVSLAFTPPGRDDVVT